MVNFEVHKNIFTNFKKNQEQYFVRRTDVKIQERFEIIRTPPIGKVTLYVGIGKIIKRYTSIRNFSKIHRNNFIINLVNLPEDLKSANSVNNFKKQQEVQGPWRSA